MTAQQVWWIGITLVIMVLLARVLVSAALSREVKRMRKWGRRRAF